MLEFNWTPAEDSSGTNIFYRNGAPGQWTNKVTSSDPFLSSFTLPASPGSPYSGTVQSFSSWGIGEQAQTWQAKATANYQSANLQTLGSSMAMSMSSAWTDTTLFAAYASSTAEHGVELGQCQKSSGCAQASAWTWGAINQSPEWKTLQISSDYVRNWHHGGQSSSDFGNGTASLLGNSVANSATTLRTTGVFTITEVNYRAPIYFLDNP